MKQKEEKVKQVPVCLVFLLAFLMTGCGPSQSEYDFPASSIGTSASDEKTLLRSNNYFGNYTNPIIRKESGSIVLKVWQPYFDYAKSLPSQFASVMLDGEMKLRVEYDEIWEHEYDDLFTEQEKIKYKGKFDITRLYWKDNRVQAYTLQKHYEANPITGVPVNKYVITGIVGRNTILRDYDRK